MNSRKRCSLTWLLSEELIGLADTSLEEVIVLHDKLDVSNREIDQHTSDLWSLWSNKLIHKLVENSSYLILVVRVLGDDSREDLVAGHDESLVHGQLLLWDRLLCTSHLLTLVL